MDGKTFHCKTAAGFPKNENFLCLNSQTIIEYRVLIINNNDDDHNSIIIMIMTCKSKRIGIFVFCLLNKLHTHTLFTYG